MYVQIFELHTSEVLLRSVFLVRKLAEKLDLLVLKQLSVKLKAEPRFV